MSSVPPNDVPELSQHCFRQYLATTVNKIALRQACVYGKLVVSYIDNCSSFFINFCNSSAFVFRLLILRNGCWRASEVSGKCFVLLIVVKEYKRSSFTGIQARGIVSLLLNGNISATKFHLILYSCVRL